MIREETPVDAAFVDTTFAPPDARAHLRRQATPAEWARVKAVVQAALDQPPAGRAAVVAELCAGDEALRAEVESLLAAAADDDSDSLPGARRAVAAAAAAVAAP